MILPGRLLVVLSAFATGCDAGAVVDIGDARPAGYRFGTPRLLAELDVGFNNENPTLTADLRELYFNSSHGGETGSDVWVARRDSAADPFGAPVLVAGLDTISYEGNPAISLDGLSLYFGSDRDSGAGDIDIWGTSRATRTEPWSVPENIGALNSPAKDLPRPPGQHGLVMPLSSKPGAVYQTFLAARPSTGAPFGKPVLVSELAFTDRTTVDGFLTDDGLTLFYSSSPLQYPADAGPRPGDASANSIDGGPVPSADLFVAMRRSTTEEFSAKFPLDDLNTSGDERDPWLTPDGKTLYFTSDRDGALSIYTAAVKPR